MPRIPYRTPCGAFGSSEFPSALQSHIRDCAECQDLIAQEEARFAAEQDDRQPMPAHDSWGRAFSSFRNR